MIQPKLDLVVAMGNQKLLLQYQNGEKRVFDVKPYISGKWFEELMDEKYFKTVRVLPDGSGIEWENGQDIAPHELYELSRVFCE